MTKKCDGEPCFNGSARGGRAACSKCHKQFHLKCVNLTGNQYKAVRECPGAFWFCVVCRNGDITSGSRSESYETDNALILQRITSVLKLVGIQIDVSRSICRAISSLYSRPKCCNSATKVVSPARPTQNDSRNFLDELERMQFEFTEVFNSFINNDPPSSTTGGNKRDRTSSSTSSFPRNDKRMRVDVSVGTSDNTDIIVPLLADMDEFSRNNPPDVESTAAVQQLATTQKSNAATTNQAIATTNATSATTTNVASATANATAFTSAITTTTAAVTYPPTINSQVSTITAVNSTASLTTNTNQATSNAPTALPHRDQAASTIYFDRNTAENASSTAPCSTLPQVPLPHRVMFSTSTVSTSTNATSSRIPSGQHAMPTHMATSESDNNQNASLAHYLTIPPQQSNVVFNSSQNTAITGNYRLNTDIMPPPVAALSVAPPSTPLKWYYLTRFQPHETADNIISFIVSKTKCDPTSIICHKLVRDNRNANFPLTFISFKLSVPATIESFVTTPHFWPTGISIKPFFARNTSNEKPFLGTGRQRFLVQNTPSPRYRAALSTRHQQQMSSPLPSPFVNQNSGILPHMSNQQQLIAAQSQLNRITSTMV